MRTRTLPVRSGPLTLEVTLTVPDDARWLVLLCHGIPGGGPRDPNDEGYAGLARAFADAGHAAAWFDFRGSRSAPGDFSMRGWCDDLAAVLDTLAGASDAAGLPRAVVGSSAGGAAAIVVGAGRTDIDALATLAAPASFEFATADRGLLLQRFRNSGLIRDPAFPRDVDAWFAEFDEIQVDRSLRTVRAPVLLVHGDADDVVPYPHAERLFAAAAEPKELVRIPSGGHQLRRDPRAVEAVLEWLDRRPRPLRPVTARKG